MIDLQGIDTRHVALSESTPTEAELDALLPAILDKAIMGKL